MNKKRPASCYADDYIAMDFKDSVLNIKRLYDLTYQDMADILGLSCNSVKNFLMMSSRMTVSQFFAVAKMVDIIWQTRNPSHALFKDRAEKEKERINKLCIELVKGEHNYGI